MTFVSLCNKTKFSLLNSLIGVDELFARAKELGQPAVAVTEAASLASAVPAYKASKKHGVKLIIGNIFNFVDDLTDSTAPFRHVNLIAKNQIGYQNLLKLQYKGFDHKVVAHKRVYPRIDWNLLSTHAEGLICLTGDASGILGQLINNRQNPKAEALAIQLKELFGVDLGLEIIPANLRRAATDFTQAVDQQLVNNYLIKLSKKLDIPIVPTCNAHYLRPEQAEAHDVALAIFSQKAVKFTNRPRLGNDNGVTPDFYLKTREEVISFFSRLYSTDAPTWCDNAVEFASRCEDPAWIMPQFSAGGKRELPTFPVKDQPDFEAFKDWIPTQTPEIQALEHDKSYLRYRATTNLKKKPLAAPESEYLDRFYKELEVLETKGFSSYMLICSDILDWCRQNEIPIGPARGSAGNCLLAYLLDIHKIDSVKYKLLFERFQNKDRVLEPDCDLDVSQKYKPDVEQYIIKKYGQENVAFISTFLTLSPKPYVKKIAQVFQYGGGFKEAIAIGNALSEAIPDDLSIHTIDDACKASGLFSEYSCLMRIFSVTFRTGYCAIEVAIKANIYSQVGSVSHRITVIPSALA
jgi:DNA polymerase-3 subunit alpha